MKNSKKVFILTEAVLGVLAVLLAALMLLEENEGELYKVSVIIDNSEDNQWTAFRYGLRMAATDQQLEMSVVSTEGGLTLEEQQSLIRQEIDNGADGIIVQPVSGQESEDMLKKTAKKVPIMLVETSAVQEKEDSALQVTSPDNQAMGEALAKELLKDCDDNNIGGKSLGILSGPSQSQALLDREKGFRDTMKGTGARVSWSVSAAFGEEEDPLEDLPKVDFVIALDDESLTAAGEYSAANDLHGAIVYGIGNSTEAAYYLDTGEVECIVVPDEFNVGYQSLQTISEKLKHFFGKLEDRSVSHTVIRRDTLFTKENQEILFTMSQ